MENAKSETEQVSASEAETQMVLARDDGPKFDDVVRVVKMPPGPEVMSSEAAALYRIADALEDGVSTARNNMRIVQARHEELLNMVQLFLVLLGTTLVVQSMLLFVAAFR